MIKAELQQRAYDLFYSVDWNKDPAYSMTGIIAKAIRDKRNYYPMEHIEINTLNSTLLSVFKNVLCLRQNGKIKIKNYIQELNPKQVIKIIYVMYRMHRKIKLTQEHNVWIWTFLWNIVEKELVEEDPFLPAVKNHLNL